MAIPDPATTEWVPIWTQAPIPPAPHHTTHEPGGSDAITVLPAHHASHDTGGADAIAALSATVLTTGLLADARLSTNVPLKNAANTFTQRQTVLDLTILNVAGYLKSTAGTGVVTGQTTIPATDITGTFAKATLPSTIAYEDEANTFSQHIQVTSNPGTLYYQAPIEVTAINHPRIAFHWPGYVASQIGMDISGVIRTYDNPGSGFASFACGAFTSNGTIVATGSIHSGTGYIYPGTGSGTQSSWYLYGHSSYGLATNTGLYVAAAVLVGTYVQAGTYITCASNMTCGGYVQSTGVMYPGRIDAAGAQGDYYLASHYSYGLYSNTGLYLGGGLYPAGGMSSNYLTGETPPTDFTPSEVSGCTITANHASMYWVHNGVMTVTWMWNVNWVETTTISFRIPAGRAAQRYAQCQPLCLVGSMSASMTYTPRLEVPAGGYYIYMYALQNVYGTGRFGGQIQIYVG